MGKIKELLHKKLMHKNTLENEIETLKAEIGNLKKDIQEIKNDRNSKRDTIKNANTRTFRGKSKKVHTNKRATN